MRIFRKLTQEELEEKLKKEGSNNFDMYKEGRDMKIFEGTKEELEAKLGKPVRLIYVGEVGDKESFVEHTYERFQFIGRLGADYLIGKTFSRCDKEGNEIYKYKLAKVE